MLALITVGA